MSQGLEIRPLDAPLRREIENRLRSAIIQGHFKGGERLVERELCDMLGVSRPSLREALRQLEAEELVINIPNRGPVVAAVTIEEAREIYQVRAMLEGLAARLFARNAPAADVTRLRQALRNLNKAGHGKSPAPMLVLDLKTQFYEILLNGCGNRVIRRMITQLNNRVSFLRATSLAERGRLRASIAEVSEIVEAIERRDEEAAWLASVNHVQHAADVAIGALLRRDENARKSEA